MNRYLKKSIIAMAVGTAIAGLSFQAQATNGYFSHGYGTKAKGMGGAGVALPQDSLAAATNPAGMVRVGNRWDVGAEIFVPDREATTFWGNNAAPNATTYDGNGSGYGESWFLIPEVGYNRMINNNLSAGVSIFGNGGMNTTWNGPIFSQGTNPTQNTGIDLAQLFISPTLSFKADDRNSFGISMNIVYQRIKVEGITDFGGISSNAAALSDRGYDSSYGVGFRVGWIGDLTDTVSAGFTYQPKTKMSRFDKYSGLFAEQGKFDIPSNFALGVSWKATPKMTLALDVEKINYKDIKAIANPNTGFLGGSLGTNTGPGFGWNNMTIIKLGVNFRMNQNLEIRAGWNHGDQPIPNGETLFNVLAPATVEDHLTLGFTQKMGGGELSGYYMHAFNNTVNGTGVVAFPGAQNAGGANIGMSQNAFGITYGKKY